MKPSRTIGIGISIIIILLAVPLTAWAEAIGSWEPDEYDYGDVVLGSSVTQIFTFEVTEVPLELYTVTLVTEGHPFPAPSPYEEDAFEITSAPPEGTIWIPSSFEVEVKFTPNTEGAHEVFLRVESNDAYGNEDIRIRLFGMGVIDEPDPSKEMEELIALFEASVDEGSIEGFGYGRRSVRRLRAFRHLLKAADNLIDLGFERLACTALFFADRKSDGVYPPPDFIEGSGREAINEGIIDVMNYLDCEVCW